MEKLKDIAETNKIRMKDYPDFDKYEPVFNMIIDECCKIAHLSGKPVIATRIREYMLDKKH